MASHLLWTLGPPDQRASLKYFSLDLLSWGFFTPTCAFVFVQTCQGLSLPGPWFHAVNVSLTIRSEATILQWLKSLLPYSLLNLTHKKEVILGVLSVDFNVLTLHTELRL